MSNDPAGPVPYTDAEISGWVQSIRADHLFFARLAERSGLTVEQVQGYLMSRYLLNISLASKPHP